MIYRGPLFRAINPIFAREPLSGQGAAVHGGRFNPRGTPALYTSISVMTALREVSQAGSLQPTTLVSYEAYIEHVFHAGNEVALEAEGMSHAVLLASRWRDEMKASGEAPTQALARRLMDKGYNGLLVRSLAPGATEDDLNLVLWRWGNALPHRLTLIDDEERLSR